MSTSLLAAKLYMPSARPELTSRPQLIERLNAALRLGQTLAPIVFLSTTVVLAVACTPSSPLPPPEPTTAPTVARGPSLVLPYSDQGLRFERISIKQGISHSTVNCIIQDSRGFVCLGS
jgi:hypothetical protein